MSSLRVLKMLPKTRLNLVLLAGSVFFSGAAFAQTEAAPNPTEAYFKTNCVMCHGADGAGSPFGKRVGVPDLRSKEVQSMPSAGLAKIIAGGKNNMPAFGTRLDNAQIQKLVDYIRKFHAPPPPPQ